MKTVFFFQPLPINVLRKRGNQAPPIEIPCENQADLLLGRNCTHFGMKGLIFLFLPNKKVGYKRSNFLIKTHRSISFNSFQI